MQIDLVPDMSIEPGHQVIKMELAEDSKALSFLLTGERDVWLLCKNDESADTGVSIHIPHTAEVDARIVELIDQLAHVRFSAPGLVQMTMAEVDKP